MDLLAVQGTLKSLLQHHSSKAPILRCSAFFIVQLSHPYMTTGETICSDFEAPKIKSVTVCIISPSVCQIKRRLLLGRIVMTNLDSILKSRDITLPTKVHLVKVMVFSVVMHGCESWTIKIAERRRIDAFELWC